MSRNTQQTGPQITPHRLRSVRSIDGLSVPKRTNSVTARAQLAYRSHPVAQGTAKPIAAIVNKQAVTPVPSNFQPSRRRTQIIAPQLSSRIAKETGHQSFSLISHGAQPRPAPTLESFFESKKSTPQTSQKPTSNQFDSPATKKSPKKNLSILVSRLQKKHFLIGLAAALIAITGYATIDALLINHEARANTAHPVSNSQTGSQDETAHPVIDETRPKPDVISSYQVAGDLPRLITIDSIGVRARILRMSIDAKGALDTPKNSFDTGWYDGSAKPGEAGAMLINGHYSGLTSPGIFHKLDKLATGSIITVEKGDGSVLKYAVESVTEMPSGKVPMNELLISSKPGVQSLNLITCSGTFDAKNQTYDKRVVVRASAI